MSGAAADLNRVYDELDAQYAEGVTKGEAAVAQSHTRTEQTMSGIRHIQEDAAPRVEAIKDMFKAPRKALKQKKILNRARRGLSFWAVWARLHPRIWWARLTIVALFLWAFRRPIVTAIIVFALGWLLVVYWTEIFAFLARAWATLSGLFSGGTPQPPPSGGT